jgi:hypothetical protein
MLIGLDRSRIWKAAVVGALMGAGGYLTVFARQSFPDQLAAAALVGAFGGAVLGALVGWGVSLWATPRQD